MFEQTLRADTKRILATVGEHLASDLAHGYLAGGTALALHLGHRESIDLDFFFPEALPVGLRDSFARLGTYTVRQQDAKTLDGVLDTVQVSAFVYPYPLLQETATYQGVRIASVADIAAMKIDATASRGSKKDFIDLYALLERYSLEELIALFEKKFSHISYNKMHILKSLTYFEDAEDEPMPMVEADISWDRVKEKIRAESRRFLERA